MSSRAFWTFQHGCPLTLTHTFGQRCSLTAISTSWSRGPTTLRYAGAGSGSRRLRPAGARGRPGARAAGTYVEPIACVLRGLERVPRGRVLVVGCGFVGRLFASVLAHRGDEVYALEPRDERRCAPEPDGQVDAAVLCSRAGGDDALAL